MLFGTIKRPRPTDFVLIVQRECVPVVRAIKEYKRDHSTLPETLNALVPHYLSASPAAEHRWYSSEKDYGLYAFTVYGQSVIYRIDDRAARGVGNCEWSSPRTPPRVTGYRRSDHFAR